MNALEAVLRLIEAAGPGPWFPRQYVKASGIDPEALNVVLEQLWLERLIDRAGGTPETGPGVVLTPLGARVLQEPEALARLREGRPVSEDPGAIVGATLRVPPRPVLSRQLLAANLLAF